MRFRSFVWLFLLIILGACTSTGGNAETGLATAVSPTAAPLPSPTASPTPTSTPFPENVITREAEIGEILFFPPLTISIAAFAFCTNVLGYQTVLEEIIDNTVSITVAVILDDTCHETDFGNVEQQSVHFDPLALSPDATEVHLLVNGQISKTFSLVTDELALAEAQNTAFADGCPLDPAEVTGILVGFGRFCLLLPPSELENVYADYQRFRAEIVQDGEPALRLTVDGSTYLGNTSYDYFLAETLPSEAMTVGELELDGETAVLYENDLLTDQMGAVRYLLVNQEGRVIWLKLEALAANQAQLFEDIWGAAVADFRFNYLIEE